MSEFWRVFAATFLGQALLLGALTFLARTIITQWLSKDLERFKGDLAVEATRSAEQFKAELSRQATEHQVTFSALHARRAEAIEGLHSALVAARYTTTDLVTTWSAKNREQFEAARTEFYELRRLVEDKSIYLPSALHGQLRDAIPVLWKPAVAAGVWAGARSDQNREEAERAFEEAVAAVSDGGVVSVAIAALENEFRRLLGQAA